MCVPQAGSRYLQVFSTLSQHIVSSWDNLSKYNFSCEEECRKLWRFCSSGQKVESDVEKRSLLPKIVPGVICHTLHPDRSLAY